MTVTDETNKLDFVPGVSFLPWEWRNLGSVFNFGASEQRQSLHGRCTFTVRQGYDPLEQATTGRVLDGQGDLGITLKHKTLAMSLSLGNIVYKQGLDDPSQSSPEQTTLPSLKATVAKEYKDDSYISFSYDVKQKKPEFAVCWSGTTPTERATLCLHGDPVQRSLKLGAAFSTPRPEWRNVVYNEDTDLIEFPKDDGGRHMVYIEHEVKHRDLFHRTRVGCRLDVGRATNFLADFVHYNLRDYIPQFYWRLPLSQTLYNLLVPPEDSEQVRHNIRGWELDVAHDFNKRLPSVGLSKRLKYATLTASYDLEEKEASLQYSRTGIKLGAKLARMEGLGWKQPALYLHVEPLGLL